MNAAGAPRALSLGTNAMRRVAELLILSALLGGVACSPTKSDAALPIAEPQATEVERPAQPRALSEDQAGEPVAVEPLGLPGRTDGCAPGMVRVEGEYCP